MEKVINGVPVTNKRAYDSGGAETIEENRPVSYKPATGYPKATGRIHR
ncbi:hypothetical protein GCM10023081_36080 [Arthrobacter ginkgonis]|uniref:Uncharacterized protein n=1 Tax=Arthrobacter ginkgonis TaxID=1630594 RepID=A0ABP7CVW6_9MICC